MQGIGYFIFSSDMKLRSLCVIIVVVGSCTNKMLNSQDRVSHEGYVHRLMLEVLFESETGRKESKCLSVQNFWNCFKSFIVRAVFQRDQ